MKDLAKSGILAAIFLSAFIHGNADATPKWYETADHFSVLAPETNDWGTYITVKIENPDNRIYIAYNLDIILPAGITFPVTGATDQYVTGDIFLNTDDGLYPATRTPMGYMPIHMLGNSIKDGGTRAKVICYSNTNSEFLKTGGKAFDCYVDIHPLAKAGVNKVKFRDMVFASKDPVTTYPIEWLPSNVLQNYDWCDIVIPAERTVTVNISADNKWDTLILPFSYDNIPDDVTIYKAEYINTTDEVELSTVDFIEPYKPYIVYAPQGWETSISGIASEEDFPDSPAMFGDDEYSALYPTHAIASHGVLQTNIRPHTLTEGYTFTVTDGEPMFKKVDAENPQELTTGDVFIAANDNDHADTLSLKPQVSTSVTTIKEENALGRIYNLQGIPVANPQPGEIYIKEGHTFKK